MRGARAHVADALVDLRVHIAFAQFAALGVVADQVRDRASHVQHAVRVAEHLLVAPVPGHQPHVRVHHADAGADVLQRGGQDLAVEAQLLPCLIQHGDHFAQFHARAAQHAGQHDARGGGADGGGQQALGELHPGAVGGRVGLQLAFQQLRLLGEGAARMPFADHAFGQGTQVAHAHAAGPFAGHQRGALRIRVEEGRGAQPLVHAGTRACGDDHHRAGVDQQRPERAVGQRVPAAQAEQLLRAQPVDAEGAVVQPRHAEPAGLRHRWQQQGIDPCRETQHHAGLHAAPAGAAPVQSADQARGELRHGRERHQPVRGQRVVAAAAVVGIGGQGEQQDRHAADPQHARGHVGLGVVFGPAAPQQHRHDQVVADHRRQRDAGHDHHAGRRGEAAHVGDDRQRGAPFGQRQRQHVAVVGHAGAAEQRRARCRDGHHHQREQHQVATEQPARLADVAHVAALHHRHMELARQADESQETQQRLRDEAHRRCVLEQRARGVGDAEGVVAQPQVGEHAHRDHRHQLDHRFQRDRQHHAVVVLGGVHLAGAEQRGEQRHQQRDIQRWVGEEAMRAVAAVAAEHAQAHRHGLVLQGQIGHHADQGDDRDQRGQPTRAAVARGNEVGDGNGVLAARDQRQPLDDAPAEQQQQQRSQVDRQVAQAVAHRAADRAVERPR